ncbi:DUF397 domain-containing protein [Streptomyces sp. NPDC057621]|uniref:DUF397 domain-containing protein n=1 Tax=unclassified Streptomyces TaxID=2593676 RepID=UPI00367579CF
MLDVCSQLPAGAEESRVADGDLPELIWRKSSVSDPGDCVEVALGRGRIRVRDSKRPAGPNLAFCNTSWSDFLCDLLGRRSDRTTG